MCQVAGREYTQWDDFRVDGRRDGGRQEMTLEDLFSHIKVAAPSSPQPENTPTLSSHPARLNAYFSVTVFRWALLPSCQRRQSSLFKKKKDHFGFSVLHFSGGYREPLTSFIVSVIGKARNSFRAELS